jgi:cell division protein FtsW
MLVSPTRTVTPQMASERWANPQAPPPVSLATGLVLVTASLMTVGLVAVASAGAGRDPAIIAWPLWATAFGKQVLYSMAGFGVLLAAAAGGHRVFAWRWRGWMLPSLMLVAITVALLAATLHPQIGALRNGARRWIEVGPLSLQSSELGKVALVIALAACLARRPDAVRSLRRGLLPACAWIGVLVLLVGLQDFGTAALMAVVGGGMLLVAGARRRHVFALAVPALLGLVALIRAEPYRVTRLTAFRDIWSDPTGAGYHPIQSLVTVASGGWTGRGLGAGIQKYGYLPESRSDFIFALVCEESGVIGGVLVLGLYAALLYLGWCVVRRAPGAYERLLAFGVTTLIGLQALINVAVVLVCAPTKGISLPFVSAGGSGVVCLGLAMGLLVSVARVVETPPQAEGGAA